MSKRIISIIITVFFSVLIASGIVYAANRNITARLGGVANDVFELSGGLKVNALKVAGTSFLTGAILNNSATAGADNPLIFADNVRVDGRVFRGAKAGPGDGKPFIINDDAQVVGSLSTASLTVNGAAVGTKKIYEGTLDLASTGDEIVTLAPGNSCTPDTNIKYYKYYYKKLAIPEITLSDLPEIRTYCHAHVSGVMSTTLPNNKEVWMGCTFYYAEGYGYLLYKYENETCAGNISSTSYYFDGHYKIIIYN